MQPPSEEEVAEVEAVVAAVEGLIELTSIKMSPLRTILVMRTTDKLRRSGMEVLVPLLKPPVAEVEVEQLAVVEEGVELVAKAVTKVAV